MKTWISFLLNPVRVVAGGRALVWGLLGIAVTIVLSIGADVHFHGILHYGSAPNPAWWCFAAEHLLVFLVPALLLYLTGLLFSRSRIRVVDVFGTIAFAQLPFVGVVLCFFPPAVQRMIQLTPQEMLLESNRALLVEAGLWTLPSLVFIGLMLIWLGSAISVSCNLRGWRLFVSYVVTLIGGDAICRYLIGLLY